MDHYTSWFAKDSLLSTMICLDFSWNDSVATTKKQSKQQKKRGKGKPQIVSFVTGVSWIDLDQVSFVNSICTIRGGTHVTHVSDQIVEVRGLVGLWFEVEEVFFWYFWNGVTKVWLFFGWLSILYFVTRWEFWPKNSKDEMQTLARPFWKRWRFKAKRRWKVEWTWNRTT